MKITADWITAPASRAVCAMLDEAGFQALYVGGCVRNALLGEPVKDIDIATDALPAQVIACAGAAGFKPVPTGVEHGTVTVVADGTPFEITTFRRDVETDGRRAVVAFSGDVMDDARRRDFTINALYAKPDGTLVDPLGGLDDLKARRFRFIEDPVERIREDYLRILRFFRFNAWYGSAEAGLDPEGLVAIADNLDGLANLSKERVGAEMLRMLGAPDPAFAVAAMERAGVLLRVLPGSGIAVLGPLIHLEEQVGVCADAIRRLAALGGEDIVARLRLSKAEAARLAVLRDGLASGRPAGELGYRHGVEKARDILLLRAAAFGGPIDPAELSQAEEGAAATFPLRAADFQPALDGPALGEALKSAERRWINSGFRLSREDLLR